LGGGREQTDRQTDEEREMNIEVEQKKGMGKMTLLGYLSPPPKCSKVKRYRYSERSMPNTITEFMKLYWGYPRNITKL